jgi:NADH-quinone oxidoreductase subunit C
MGMNEQQQSTFQSLHERLGGDLYQFRGEDSLVLPPGKIEKACQILLKELGFERLSGITAVDYWPKMEPRYHLIYLFHSFRQNRRFTIRVAVPGQEPTVPTIEKIYPNANWHEREIWDMFGIRFEGHSDHRRILMPEDWVGHPLRKDYPLGYEEVQFTFNVEEINHKKPSPKD